MAKFKLDVKILKKVGAELEELLNPSDDNDEPISLTKGDLAELSKKIKDACGCLNTSDPISKELEQVIEYFGIELPDPEEAVDPDSDETDEEESDVDEESDEEDESEDVDEEEEEEPEPKKEKAAKKIEKEEPEEEEESLVEQVQNTKKLSDLKDLVRDNDEFKKLRKGIEKYTGIAGPRDLKKEMFQALGVKKEDLEKKKTEKKAKKEKSGPSNKEVVYKAWIKKKTITVKDAFDLVSGNVKETTIKNWMKDWSKGNNLPACAKKE